MGEDVYNSVVAEAEWYAKLDFKKMDQESIEAEVRKRVYNACLVFERLEDAGRIRGNGHHMAQDFSTMAANEIRERWNA